MFAQLSALWGVVSLGLLWLAWRAAVARRWSLHRNLMIFLTLGAWVFITSYLLRYGQPGAMPEIDPAYIPWLAIHGTLGLVPLFGASLLVISRLRHGPSASHLNRHHRLYGRSLMIVWVFTHLGGIANYFLFY
ncbi:MAG: hypothetical protein CL910_07440 [Deltaproteobacteria bacterium]|nr:hypothetical protein [Deltaproteobacteria bacterium]